MAVTELNSIPAQKMFYVPKGLKIFPGSYLEKYSKSGVKGLKIVQVLKCRKIEVLKGPNNALRSKMQKIKNKIIIIIKNKE